MAPSEIGPRNAIEMPKLIRHLAKLLLAGFMLQILPIASSQAGEQPGAAFVGGRICSGCHRAEAALWQGSHHDQAMQEANERTVLGDFNNATLAHFGVTSRFY